MKFYGALPKAVFIIAGLAMIVSHADGQSPFFEKAFALQGAEVASSLRQLPDSSILLFGYAENGSNGGYDYCLLKTDAAGNLLWRKFYGTPANDQGFSLDITSDNNLILIGSSQSVVVNNADDVLLIKIDTAGNEIWRRTFAQPGSQICTGITTGVNGDFLLAGSATDANGFNDHLLMRTDSAGTLLWQYQYGGGDNDYAHRVLETANGDLILSGDTKSQGAGLYDANLLRLNNNGIVIWDSAYGDALQNGCQGALQGIDGYFYVYGETEIFPASAFDGFMMKVDSAGHRLWTNNFGGTGTEAVFDMVQDSDGKFTGCGYSNSSTSGMQPLNVGIFRLDSADNYQWTREFGGAGIDIGLCIRKALGGGYLVAGRKTQADDDMYLLHLDDNGLTPVDELNRNEVSANVFPNPSNGISQVQSRRRMIRIGVTDMSGRQVFTMNDRKGAFTESIDAGMLEDGVYLLQITDISNSTVTIKWIVKK